ncbi:MAG: helix-turn-helix domain-containing protein [Candidatus Verstraetearchaeota archaeon]|nr:helix-turn-helix domain-containing protein [Candidatus Verstraetearchaeota archaeon]
METQPAELQTALERLEKELSAIKVKLEEILSLQRQLTERIKTKGLTTTEVPTDGIDVGMLLNLPDHLRKTLLALTKLVEARADEVAEITQRARAIESGYLNQLVRLGYVKKIRKKHQIYFTINNEE